MWWRRLIPVALLGILSIGYVLARPSLQERIPHLVIAEFPLGALVVGTLVWAALARRDRPEPPPEWRRHEQVVRQLPDPAIAPYVAALERWIETGEGAPNAADVLARSATSDLREQERLRSRIESELNVKASRRKRESLLKKYVQHGA